MLIELLLDVGPPRLVDEAVLGKGPLKYRYALQQVGSRDASSQLLTQPPGLVVWDAIQLDLEGAQAARHASPEEALGNDVNAAALTCLPRLDLVSSRVIEGMATVNLAVAQAKEEMVWFRSELGLTELHLVVKAPSVFAILLGYRLNGLAHLQLYELGRDGVRADGPAGLNMCVRLIATSR